MAATYRFTQFWNWRNMGDTETYWTGSVEGPSAGTAISTLVALRAGLMPQGSNLEGVRIAQEGALRQSWLLVPGGDYWQPAGVSLKLPSGGTFGNASLSNNPDQWRAILQARLVATDPSGNSIVKMRYLSGIPDGVSATEPKSFNPGGNPDWTDRLTAFRVFLTQGQFFVKCLAKITGAALIPYQIIGVYPAPTGSTDIAVGLALATYPGFAVGQRVHVYNMRPAKGTRNPTLNGTWYVSGYDTATTPGVAKVYLRGSGIADPTLQRFTDKSYILPVAYAYAGIKGLDGIRVGIHKRGKPGLSPRGRRLIRATLDP
jgi:hypothetical protein